MSRLALQVASPAVCSGGRCRAYTDTLRGDRPPMVRARPTLCTRPFTCTPEDLGTDARGDAQLGLGDRVEHVEEEAPVLAVSRLPVAEQPVEPEEWFKGL